MNKLDTEKKELGHRLRTARDLAGLSQGQAAKILGFHRPTISEIEAGRRNVKVDELKLFANLYGVEMSWLAENKIEDSKLNKDILAAARELSAMNEDDLNILINTIRMIKSKGK
jgi:transcriptional regulator with XRE-family HTH domain